MARRLGVAPATLRTWARRYGVGPPAHTAGEHRQYTAADLTRLLVMRRLTLEGVAPAEAARIALSTPVPDDPTNPLASVTALPTLFEAVGRPEPVARAPERPVDLERLDLDGDLPDLEPGARELVVAARSLDGAACRSALRRQLDRRGLVDAWELVVVPALGAVGDFWRATGNGAEVERVLSDCVMSVLYAITQAAPEPVRGGALLACAEEEQHVLPLHALRSALAERRIDAQVLGARVPHRALESAIERSRPRVLLLYASTPVGPLQLQGLAAVEERAQLLLGGPGWHGLDLPDGAVLAPSLAAAVDQVRLAVRH